VVGSLYLASKEIFSPTGWFKHGIQIDSVREVYEKTLQLEMWNYPQGIGRISDTIGGDHQGCNIAGALQKQCADLLPTLETIMTEAQKKHVRRQALRCGTANY